MKNYEYKVQLLEDPPVNIPLNKLDMITTNGEWYGHSFGDVVGRIYDDGTVESFFKCDKENKSNEIFETLRISIQLRKRHRHLYNYQTSKEYSCTDYYAMRRVVDHCSEQPTVIYERLDNCCNVKYEYTYEILLIANEEWRRYVTNQVLTEGLGSYTLFDAINSLEELFADWALKDMNGFSTDSDGNLLVKFYNDFGEERELVFTMSDLLSGVNSVRIIKIEEHSKEDYRAG